MVLNAPVVLLKQKKDVWSSAWKFFIVATLSEYFACLTTVSRCSKKVVIFGKVCSMNEVNFA